MSELNISDIPEAFRDVIAGLDEAALAKLIIRVENKLSSEHSLELYKPYEKQKQFHAAGVMHRERLLMAGNQLGKTYSAAAETAMHLTGDYPDDWVGRRFDRATVGWAGGVTTVVTRDTVQRLLLGRYEQLGTGMIPKSKIISHTMQRGITGAVDTVTIRHKSGGVSQLAFKSFEQGREKWQGETLDFVWFDEEPPEDIYSEGVTRTNATGGIAYTTFTPLQGISDVVKLFYPRPNTPDRHLTMMTIDDAEHFDDEQRARVVRSYKAHERDARARGIPTLGSGKIFVVPESAYTVNPFPIPKYWLRIAGIDFGWDHPTAAVELAYDIENDTIYVIKTHRRGEDTVANHSHVLAQWGKGLPFAWPHDGNSHEKGSGETLAKLYAAHEIEMLPEHATFEGGGNSVEAGVAMILDRLENGTLKIFAHLVDLLEEMRMYHRDNGKIVKVDDDLVSALRYAIMMIRYAVVPKKHKAHNIVRRRSRAV